MGPSRRSILAVLLALAVAGCGEEPLAPRAADLSIVSGYGQTAPAGTTLPEPLVVQVSDLGGRTVAGVTVTWQARDGSFASATSTTDAEGIASNTWTLAPAAGTQLARAILPGGAADIVFLATATAAAAEGGQGG